MFADIGDVPPQQVWAGVVVRAIDAERLTMGLLELDPGTDVPEHSHENEQVGILLEGSLTFRAGGETKELGPGGTWCIPSHVPHSVTSGPDGAVAFEIFAPVREEWHALEREAARPPRWPRSGSG
jgi:quercetin dioxygenase-like cupin family protein